MRWKEWAVELYERCRDAEHRYPGLALDLIELYPPNRRMPNRELKTIVQQHAGPPPDVEVEFLEDLLVARFYGRMEGYREFQSIGQEIYRWLRSTDPDLPAKGSYHGWLKILRDITRCCPAVGFELAHNPASLKTDIISDVLDFSKDFSVLYAVARYKHSPFELSSSALCMFIEPYQIRFLREYSSKVHLVPWQLRCVFANPRIARLDPAKIVASGLKDAIAVLSANDPFERPRFFGGPNFSGKLILAGRTVLKVQAGSTAICAVLRAFEESGWPEQMDTPESLGEDREHAARDVADKLNRRQKGSLQIRFTALNSGRAIRWETVTG